jgi:hypothetical protein
MDLAASRFSWVQTKLYENWNPDYLKEQPNRPQRVGPDMDARWWFWNLAFALLPAFLIGTYCEFRGKYLMEDYHRRLELHQMRRIMGDDFSEQDAKDAAPPERESLFKRLWSLAQDLTTMISGEYKLTKEVPADEVDDAPEKEKRAAKTSETLEPGTVDLASRQDAQSASSDPSLQMVLQRLEQLEEIVSGQKKNRRDKDFQRLLDRTRQSGVKSRADNQMIDSWEGRRSAARDEAVENTTTSGDDSKASSSLLSLVNVVRESATAVMKHVRPEVDEDRRDDDSHSVLAEEKLTRITERVSNTAKENSRQEVMVKKDEETASSPEDPHLLHPTGAEREQSKRWWKVW